MNGNHRAKALAALLLCLFLVPALALVSTVYLMSDVDAQWRALAAEESKTPGSDRFTTQAERLAACRSGSPAQALPSTSVDAHGRACAATNEVVWVRRLSAACVALGALMVASIYGARAFAGTNRRRMSQVFGPVVRWTMILLAMSTLAQAGLFIYGLLLVEVAVLHGIHIGIVVAGIAGALLSVLALLRVALSALSDAPLNLPARRLERADHPALFALVDGIAARLQSDPPQHIVLGLDPVFFVATADLVLAEANDHAVLRGSTLYLSLCLMRVFTVDELAAVIGHELGHLRGEDLAYSQKFAPMYARLRRALDSLNQPAGLAAEIGRIPAIAALAACESEFAAAERTAGRQRELLADRAGAEAADAMTLGRALVKSALLAGQWDILTRQHIDRLSRGQHVPNVSESYALRCETFIACLNWPAALAELDDRVQPHPVDTHPRLVDRIQGLGLTLSAFERPRLATPTDAAACLLSRAEALDADLSGLRERDVSPLSAGPSKGNKMVDAPRGHQG
jgi:Zn-dependent protease with chaperone function